MLWWTVMVALAGDPVARAWNAYELKLWDEARTEADKALEGKLDKKQRSTALLVSATARKELGEDEAALEAATACVELGSRDVQACTAVAVPLARNLGKAAYNDGIGGDEVARGRAVELLQTHAALAPDSAEGQLLLGRALLLAERPADAVAPLQAAVTAAPTPDAVGQLLIAHADSGQLDEGVAAAKAHPVGPGSVNGLLTLGQVLQGDRPDDAITLFRAAVAADDSSAVAHKLLGVALVNSSGRAESDEAARKALEEGRSELEAALAGKPDDKSVVSALAQVAKALGDDAAADDGERAE